MSVIGRYHRYILFFQIVDSCQLGMIAVGALHCHYSLLHIILFLLFIMVSMMLLIFRFEPFILGLYFGSALQAVTFSISLELFDTIDYSLVFSRFVLILSQKSSGTYLYSW